MMAGSDAPFLQLDDQLPKDRVRLAARPDCALTTLHQLARDPDLIVRATVALNRLCDAELDRILATDSDERVRALLGGRVARLLAQPDPSVDDEMVGRAETTLRQLSADEAVRVRATVAQELAAVETAPRDVILQLARDAAREVSDRIIRLSPLLKDDDLLALLASGPGHSAAVSVACRARLSAAVADAVVEFADPSAIRALLANQSACIREATLDVLIGRAPNHVDWHAPLVNRPRLSVKAVRALSEFITLDLLRVLAMRTDLEPAKTDLVRRRLLALGDKSDDDELAGIRELHAAGKLTEAVLVEAAREGDQRQLMLQLSVASGIDLGRVERVLELRSTKALVSLVWRSGFSMSLAVLIQRVISQFGPDNMLLPATEGGFPLTTSEMVWQVELLTGVDLSKQVDR